MPCALCPRVPCALCPRVPCALRPTVPCALCPTVHCGYAYSRVCDTPTPTPTPAAISARQVSTMASTSLETMAELSDGNAWFQLYFSGGDAASSGRLLERCQHAGYSTLVVTVDVPEIGRRPRELRHGFKMPFKIGGLPRPH